MKKVMGIEGLLEKDPTSIFGKAARKVYADILRGERKRRKAGRKAA